MESTDTLPDVDPDRVAALAADAVAGRPMSPTAEASLGRALGKLPGAVAASDAEARAAVE